MPGNMVPESNLPGGRYPSTDDRTRASQDLYGTDDEPQMVAEASIITGDPLVLEYKHNVRSITVVNVDEGIRVELEPIQPHADYVVDAAWSKLGDFPAHLLIANRTATSFEIFARYGNGAIYPLGGIDNDSSLVVQVRKALQQRRDVP